MRMLAVRAVVNNDMELKIKVPPGISPGEHEVVIVIDERPASRTRRPRELRFASHKSELTDNGNTFSREVIYGDDAR